MELPIGDRQIVPALAAQNCGKIGARRMKTETLLDAPRTPGRRVLLPAERAACVRERRYRKQHHSGYCMD